MLTKWQIGDRIAERYDIHQILGGEGKSGMGIVYICYDHGDKIPYALKTFQERFWTSIKIREAFRQEALLWIELERYPYIVQAHSVHELDHRLFIVLEYVAMDEQGRNSLRHYLTGYPLPLKQLLCWAIQFCYGMEYACQNGIISHNDIKPDNIMVTSDRMLKITDFGLARALEQSEVIDHPTVEQAPGLSVTHLGKRAICGTPGYMAPEVVYGEGGDVCSDIYSFSLVLYQMTCGSPTPPFTAVWRGDMERYIINIFEKQMNEKPPKLDTPVWPVIEKGLQKETEDRYQSFEELRKDLVVILKRETGEVINPPTSEQLKNQERFNKALSLFNLGKYQLSAREYSILLQKTPGDGDTHRMRGLSLYQAGEFKEAIESCKEAVRLQPWQPFAYFDLGLALREENRLEEAVEAFLQSVKVDPNFAYGYNSLGLTLERLNKLDEAIKAYQSAIKIQPDYSDVYGNLGLAFLQKSQVKEAKKVFLDGIKMNPQSPQLHYKFANMLYKQGQYVEAVKEFRETIYLDPDHGEAYCNLGAALVHLRQFKEAESAFRKAIKINPGDSIAQKNLSLTNLLINKTKGGD